ncbi:unnamed protein product, partial [Polarella glacialis]
MQSRFTRRLAKTLRCCGGLSGLDANTTNSKNNNNSNNNNTTTNNNKNTTTSSNNDSSSNNNNSNEEEFLRCVTALHFNQFSSNPVRPDGSGPLTQGCRAVYRTLCRANHSCAPNCFARTSSVSAVQDVPPPRVIRAVKPILAGEELTISYHLQLEDSSSARRKYLLSTKEFLCECSRCGSSWDDTRRFACCRCFGGYHLAAAATPPTTTTTAAAAAAASQKQMLSPCMQCGCALSSPECRRQLRIEAEVQQKLAYINSVLEWRASLDASDDEGSGCNDSDEDPEDLRSILASLRLHPHHHLTLKIAELQRQFATHDNDTAALVHALRLLAACHVAIVPWDLVSASRFESLGEVLEGAGLLQEAAAAHRKCLRMMCVLQDPGEPYPRHAADSLIRVLSRQGVSDMVAADR